MSESVNTTAAERSVTPREGPAVIAPVLKRPPVSAPLRSPRKLLWAGAAALVLIIGAILFTITRPVDGPVRREVTLPVTRMPFAGVLHEMGTVEAKSEIAVLTRFTGDIVWKTEDGKEVEAGEPIVRFEIKTLQEDIFQREKDLADKEEAVKRAETDIKVTTERYAHQIRQAEITLGQAETDRKKIYESPTPEEKLDAELSMKSAELDLERATLDLKGYEELAGQGFVSEAALKKKQLEQATAKVNFSKAKLIYDITLLGYSADARRVADLAVADAKKRLNIAKFNRDADLAVCKASLELAKVELENFNRELERKRRDLDYATIRAPIKGNVVFTEVSKGSMKIKSPIQVGESRTAGADLCTVCDTSTLRLRVWVNECDVKGLSLKQQASVTLPAVPGQTLSAEVSEIGVMAQDKNAALSSLALRKSGEAFVNVVPIKLDFKDLTEQQRRQVRVGFTAHVYIQTSEKSEALTIPWSAVQYGEQGEPYAEVEVGGRRERRKLKLGRNDDERVEILEGLKEGEQVYDQTGAFSPAGGPRS